MLLTLESLQRVCERIEQGHSHPTEISTTRSLLKQQRVHLHALLWRASYYQLKPLFGVSGSETKRELIAEAFARWNRALSRNNTMPTISFEELRQQNVLFYKSVLARDEAIEEDVKIVTARMIAYDRRDGIRVGDYVRRKDGTMQRVGHNWGDNGWADAIQLTLPGYNASFYLGDGYISHSGGLESPMSLTSIRQAEETQLGFVWFFHQDQWGAGRGVYASVPFRVYQEI